MGQIVKNPFVSQSAVVLLLLILVDIAVAIADSFHPMPLMSDVIVLEGPMYIAYVGKNLADNYSQTKYQYESVTQVSNQGNHNQGNQGRGKGRIF